MHHQPKNTSPIAPSFDPIVLPKLLEGSRADLVPSAQLDGMTFEGVEIDQLDLSNSVVEASRFGSLRSADASLRGSVLGDVVFTSVDIPIVRAARSRWRDVRFEGGRVGSAEFYDSDWSSVHFVGCKLTFVNLRGSDLRDVAFTDCIIDELDTSEANIVRLALPGTRLRRLDVSNATLAHVDLRNSAFDEITGVASLRGAVIDEHQLTLLAPLLARQIGLTVEG